MWKTSSASEKHLPFWQCQFRPQADANGAAAPGAEAAPAPGEAAAAGTGTAEGGEKKLSKVRLYRASPLSYISM